MVNGTQNICPALRIIRCPMCALQGLNDQVFYTLHAAMREAPVAAKERVSKEVTGTVCSEDYQIKGVCKHVLGAKPGGCPSDPPRLLVCRRRTRKGSTMCFKHITGVGDDTKPTFQGKKSEKVCVPEKSDIGDGLDRRFCGHPTCRGSPCKNKASKTNPGGWCHIHRLVEVATTDLA